MENIVTQESLKVVGRTKAPSDPEDYNYYVNQLVEAGQISAHTAARLYKKERYPANSDGSDWGQQMLHYHNTQL